MITLIAPTIAVVNAPIPEIPVDQFKVAAFGGGDDGHGKTLRKYLQHVDDPGNLDVLFPKVALIVDIATLSGGANLCLVSAEVGRPVPGRSTGRHVGEVVAVVQFHAQRPDVLSGRLEVPGLRFDQHAIVIPQEV